MEHPPKGGLNTPPGPALGAVAEVRVGLPNGLMRALYNFAQCGTQDVGLTPKRDARQRIRQKAEERISRLQVILYGLIRQVIYCNQDWITCGNLASRHESIIVHRPPAC
jgi:hypothetical protein